jgi:exosortase H (IPTLxxWG-CTERM-specific)
MMSPEPEDSSPRPGFFRRNKESIRICVLFGFFIGVLHLLRWWQPVDEAVIQPFTNFVAVASDFILSLFGFETARNGTTVRMGDVALNIMEECNGVPALLIYLAAVLAYPSRLPQKVMGIVIGIPAIFVVNEIRVLSLFFAAKYLSFGVFETLHVYVWQTIIILFSVLLWLYWAERFVRRAGQKAPQA